MTDKTNTSRHRKRRNFTENGVGEGGWRQRHPETQGDVGNGGRAGGGGGGWMGVNKCKHYGWQKTDESN